MFQHLPSLKALRAFEAAARHSSFSAAAEELAVSPGAISYQIKQLESNLETLLFQRRIRQVKLTAAGEQFFSTVHRQFRELDATIAQISPAQPSSTLTVSVSTYFVTRWLSSRLGHFLSAHPDITVRLQHSVNDPDFVMEKTDIAIKWGNGNWPNSQSELLIEMPMIAVCSPKLKHVGAGLNTVADLQRHHLLRDQEGTDYWAEWLQLANAENVLASGAVIVDPNVRVQAAIDAQGVILANPLLRSTIESGQLYEPFSIRLNGYGYYLVCTHQAGENKIYNIFRNWLMEEVSRM
ncbi:MAG: LysR substrate-binding domain-containing protein [Granulosicoccus sp.]